MGPVNNVIKSFIVIAVMVLSNSDPSLQNPLYDHSSHKYVDFIDIYSVVKLPLKGTLVFVDRNHHAILKHA